VSRISALFGAFANSEKLTDCWLVWRSAIIDANIDARYDLSCHLSVVCSGRHRQRWPYICHAHFVAKTLFDLLPPLVEHDRRCNDEGGVEKWLELTALGEFQVIKDLGERG
jgi:hypothetical protein